MLKMSDQDHLQESSIAHGRTTLTSTEVCEMFQIPRSTLHRWLKQGKIPEPAMNPNSRQLIWTQTEVNAISRFLAKGQIE